MCWIPRRVCWLWLSRPATARQVFIVFHSIFSKQFFSLFLLVPIFTCLPPFICTGWQLSSGNIHMPAWSDASSSPCMLGCVECNISEPTRTYSITNKVLVSKWDSGNGSTISNDGCHCFFSIGRFALLRGSTAHSLHSSSPRYQACVLAIGFFSLMPPPSIPFLTFFQPLIL